MIVRNRHRWAAISVLAFSAASSWPAHAQAPVQADAAAGKAPAAVPPPPGPDPQDDILVTGTRIRSNTTSASPVSIIGAEELAQRGTLSIADALFKEPALGSATRGPSQTLNGGGSQGVDLRNLGSRRTLALIDGRRLSIFTDEVGNTTQDIGMIPTGLLKRVEILRDSASATYGADAVSGVVNFILDSDFKGAAFNVYNGISDDGDGHGYSVSGTIGVGNDRGHLVLSGQYQNQDSIPQVNREWARTLITSIGRTAVVNNAAIAPGGTVLSRTGATLACYPITGGASVAPACPRYSAAAESDLILGTRLHSAGAIAHYDLTDGIRLYAKGFYSERDTHQRISAVQIDTTTLIGPYTNGITIPASNANNPFGQDIRLRLRLSDYGPAENRVNSSQLWTTAGLAGRVFDRFDWDVAYTRSETRSLSRRLNIPNIVNLNNLLNPILCSNDPICRSVGAIPNIADLLSKATPLTQAQDAYLFFETTINSRFLTQQATASISGALIDLPAGPVKVAVGYEHRNEEGSVTPDSVTRTTATGRTIVFPSDGSFSTNEGFAELQIPVLRDAPLFHRLTVNLQGRYSHFSNFDDARTWKAGIDWDVSEDLRVRGNWGTSFRAPDVLELYGGGTGQQSSGGTDPCNAGGQRATNATVAANCIALGVPTTYAQGSVSLPVRSGGNASLQPERGRTITAGAVVTPRFLPKLVLSADYFNIRIRDAIATGDLNRNLANCYADANFLTRAANPSDTCFGYDQRSGNALLRINNPLLNLGSQTTSGIDASLAYATDLGRIPGDLELGARGTWTASYKQNGVEYAGRFINGVNGNLSYPKVRGSADLGYRLDGFSIRWTANYVSAMTDSAYGLSIPVDNPIGYKGTSAYVSNDLVLRWKSPSQLDFTLGVNNILDRTPPYAFVATRNTLPSTYDQIGRYVFLSAEYRF